MVGNFEMKLQSWQSEVFRAPEFETIVSGTIHSVEMPSHIYYTATGGYTKVSPYSEEIDFEFMTIPSKKEILALIELFVETFKYSGKVKLEIEVGGFEFEIVVDTLRPEIVCDGDPYDSPDRVTRYIVSELAKLKVLLP